ncbi:MAG TPA: hypothetical protein VH107_02190 [Lacipirellulaceae bacterium]|jgi:hypothetical protein|nr:hypothetical protein [Lacipirellulaceae bacterium]
MSNERTIWLRRALTALVLLVAVFHSEVARAQFDNWRAAVQQPLSDNGSVHWTKSATPAAVAQSASSNHPAPLAWLIQNPDQTEGTPPYALTDQSGTVQRYVEPVPGVDLASHVGQVVSVRNDSGSTLLASQLDLPRQRLMPMVGEPGTISLASYTSPADANRSEIQQAQYVSSDGDNVQLLPDDGVVTTGPPIGAGNVPPLQVLGNGPGCGYPGEMCGPGCGPSCDSMECGPGMMQPSGPCPQCGGYHDGPCRATNCDPLAAPSASQQPHVYGDIDFKFVRTRFSEDTFGKLSETYELAPRYTLGVQNVGAVDARVRFWDYDRGTDVLGAGAVRVKLDVFDLEAVHRFEGSRSTVDLSAGLRWASWRLQDPTGARSDIDAVGLTAAADGLTACHCIPDGYCAWAYGGRLSILGGDWTGTSGFIDHSVGDDNIVVTELYAGAQVGRRCGNIDLHARAVYEIQNWHSDALEQNTSSSVGSIGFLGPALQIGAEF